MVRISSAMAGDAAVRSFLEGYNSDVVARRGELIDALRCPAIVAHEREEVAGVLTYDAVGDACEVLTLHCAEPWAGTGTLLMEELVRLARMQRCRRIWVVTTNDNVDALRFYQRRGLHLADLRCGAVEESRRTLKPTIPSVGSYGIPLRDEIELSRTI